MKHIESKLQQNCITWFDYQYPHIRLNLFSIPNEGARTPANGARMKAQGRRAGVADIFFAMPSKDYHGLFIEFKIDRCKQNDNQIAFERAVTTAGYKYVIVRSFDEFKNLIEDYM